MKLYEIMADYDRLAEMDMETEGDTTAFLELMRTLEGSFDQKAENYCKLIRNLEADAEGFKAEKDRLEKKQKTNENRIFEIKKYLKYEAGKIIETGYSRKVGLFTIAIRNNPEALEITNKYEVPKKYIRFTPPELVIDNELLKTDLKNGEIIEGARLVRGTSLRIS